MSIYVPLRNPCSIRPPAAMALRISAASATALTALLLCVAATLAEGKKVHYIHWNRNNPMFRIDNTEHIVDVNKGNLPWEYDQVNIICPTSKPGTRFPEKHVIYSVSRDEYDSCRITNPKPRIVAICNRPHRLMYFTITFRSFTPTPGGLEFHPGKDYYFVSTSSRDDLHRRVGGGCSTHNMKMIFKVSDNRPKSRLAGILGDENEDDGGRGDLVSNDIDETPFADAQHEQYLEEQQQQQAAQQQHSAYSAADIRSPQVIVNQPEDKHRGDYIYYYHPRDLIELENTIAQRKLDFDPAKNQVWQNEALRYTSSAATPTSHTVHSLAASLSLATATVLLSVWNVRYL